MASDATEITAGPDPLASAHLRIARSARNLARAEALWAAGLGLRVLERIQPQTDGEHELAMLGWPNPMNPISDKKQKSSFGHLGYSADNPVGQRLRDVIGLEIGDGTAQARKLVIARHLRGRGYAP